MDDLSRWARHPMLDMVCWLILAGLGVWYLTRVDQEARHVVERYRAWGYVIDDYSKEVDKWKTRLWWTSLLTIIGSLGGALYSATWL